MKHTGRYFGVDGASAHISPLPRMWPDHFYSNTEIFSQVPKMVGFAFNIAFLFIAFTQALVGPDTLNSAFSILIHNDLSGENRVLHAFHLVFAFV